MALDGDTAWDVRLHFLSKKGETMSKKNIAVLGAGKMGLGIAQLFATKGHQVKVI